MLKKITAVALAAAMIFSLCACGEKTKTEKVKINENELTAKVEKQKVNGLEIDEEFIYATADFSVEMFKSSLEDKISQGENVLISPESITCALAMTANGAKNETLKEMEQVITGGIDISKYNEYMYTYNNKLTSSKDISFNIANSIWVKDDSDRIRIKDEFVSTCSSYYDADLFMAPFDETTVEDINNWVNKNTDEMIPTLLKKIDDDVVMYLINAIAFQGTWESEYEDYQIEENADFTAYDGNKQKVTMLNSTEDIYISDASSTGFIKPYEGGEFAFMAILPNEGVEVEEYVAGMTGESYIEMYNNRQREDVVVKLPEFSYEYEDELSEELKGMGMELPFGDSADFTNMADTNSDPLYINRVLHKTFIQVDREGTKAAAVTAVEMVKETAVEMEEPKQVILDRPFVYAIIDVETGLPVFIGVVNTVN